MICIVCCRHAACVPAGSVSSARRPRLPCDLGCPNSSSRRFSCEASRGPSSGVPSIHLPCATNPSIHSVLWLTSPAQVRILLLCSAPLVPTRYSRPGRALRASGPLIFESQGRGRHIRIEGPRASYPSRRTAGVISESYDCGRHIRVARPRASYPSHRAVGVISESQGCGRLERTAARHPTQQVGSTSESHPSQVQAPAAHSQPLPSGGAPAGPGGTRPRTGPGWGGG